MCAAQPGHNMVRRAMLNRREKRVCSRSGMMTWIQERSYMLTYFLSDKRNRNKRNEPPSPPRTLLSKRKFLNPLLLYDLQLQPILVVRKCVVDPIPISLSLITHPRWFLSRSRICPFLENGFQPRNYISRNDSPCFVY